MGMKWEGGDQKRGLGRIVTLTKEARKKKKEDGGREKVFGGKKVSKKIITYVPGNRDHL